MLSSKDKVKGSVLFKEKLVLVVIPFSLFFGSPHTEKFVYFLLNHFLLIFVVIFRGVFPHIKVIAQDIVKVTCVNFYNWRILPR